jgi:hypothetical protein
MDLYTVVFRCLACGAESWVREWDTLDPEYAIVELAAECQHIGLTHIVHVDQILIHRTNGTRAVFIEPPENNQQRRDVARCKAMARWSGERCRNDAGIDGLCQWHAGADAKLDDTASSTAA